ncbi:MAG: DUF3887 domain-containing protein [Synechococcaceae cyanobacterium]|nr:DUF3887 domain-containing protein [Synechococcaceae cyanobacterium]
MPGLSTPFRRGLIALAAAGLLGSALPAARSQASPPSGAAATTSAPQLTSAEIEQRARQAALRILQALQSGTAESRYAQFAPRLQQVTSPAMVQRNIAAQPKLLGWVIKDVIPGMESSLVEVTLKTAAGPRELLLAIDAKGRLDGYHFDVADEPAEKVARQFIEALGQGKFVLASGFLDPALQPEIPPASLQVKWQNLQRLTGNYIKVRKAFQAENTNRTRLVLVTTEFNRLSDNLFVILNGRNEIIGVDFPQVPSAPAAP